MKLPDTLYHYTTLEGIIGIFESKSIWATDIFFLNDSSEYKYSINLLSNLLEKNIKERSVKGELIIDQFENLSKLDLMNALMSKFSEKLNTYICSLSEEGDLLSQWRGYCPMGNGFSIGFNTKSLIEKMKKYDFKICKCIYNEKDQKKILKPILDQYFSSIDASSNIVDIEIEIKEMEKIMFPFFSIASQLKDKSFKEEKEWRFFKSHRKIISLDQKFRPGKSTIIPYYEIPILNDEDEVPIKEIIIGPTPDKKLSEMSLRNFLYSEGIEEKINIILSAIPYRNW